MREFIKDPPVFRATHKYTPKFFTRHTIPARAGRANPQGPTARHMKPRVKRVERAEPWVTNPKGVKPCRGDTKSLEFQAAHSLIRSDCAGTAGGIRLFVDAKDQHAKRCYPQFGLVSLPANDLEMFLPVKTIQEVLASHP